MVKGKTRSGERLQDLIQSSLSYLDTCTELWNQERPVCAKEKSRKLAKQKLSKAPEPAEFLLKSLDDIDAGKSTWTFSFISPPNADFILVVLELASGNAAESLKKAEELMKTVQAWPEKEAPNKKEVLGTLHSCIGNALMDLGEMEKALEHHQKDLELAKQW